MSPTGNIETIFRRFGWLLNIACMLYMYYSNLILVDRSVLADTLIWFGSLFVIGTTFYTTIGRSSYTHLAILIASNLVIGVGVFQFVAVGFWLSSAVSLGALIIASLDRRAQGAPLLTSEAAVVGTAVYLAVWGAMLHFTVNYQAIFMILSFLPCLLILKDYAKIIGEVSSTANAVRSWVHSMPFWAWGSGLAVLGWVFRWSSYPTVGFDDHALHLRMWTELYSQHYYSFNISRQIWAVAPFAVDLLHSGMSMIAGTDARSAMNLAMGALLLTLMASILRRWTIPVWSQWTLIILMASTPLFGYLLMTLQTELFLAAIALAGVKTIFDAKSGVRGKHLLSVLACASISTATKLPGVILGASLLISFALQLWDQKRAVLHACFSLRWPTLWLLVPLGFTAAHSYWIAWTLTDNPFFPLYNGIFRSPHLEAVNFSNPNFTHDFGFVTFVKAFFKRRNFSSPKTMLRVGNI